MWAIENPGASPRPAPEGDPPGKTPAILLLGWLALLLPWAWLVRRFWFVTDDAYISFRYARNLASGLGLRYNPGEHPPVEGYSDFLWVILCSLFERLRLDIETAPLILSAACGALLLFLVFRLLLFRFRMHPLPAFLGALSLAAAPSFALWSTGGLETIPFALLLFLAAERMLLRRTGSAPLAGAIPGLAAALMRTEGIFWAAGIGVLAWMLGGGEGRMNRRAALRYFAVVLAGYAVYFAARYAYYGEPLANTAYVKAGLGGAVFLRGARYVASYFLAFLVPFFIVPGFFAARRRAGGKTALALAALAAANIAYAVAVGGDWMAMGRILLPALIVPGAILIAFLLDAVRDGGGARRSAAAALLGGAIVAMGVLPAFNIHAFPRSFLAKLDFRYHASAFRTEREQWEQMVLTKSIWKFFGKQLKEIAAPGESCACGAIGAIGYYSGLYVYDTNGLVTPAVAKGESAAEARSPGHDKHVPLTFFMDEKPTYLLHVTPMTSNVALSMIRRWRGGPYGRDYVAASIPLTQERGAPPTALLYFRRIRPEEDPGEAWRLFLDGFSAR
ncbi:MAG: hypothetical protein JW958_13955 [Candidatus Eisenbacteria bacterium]|nr:hypothetical protein [Candidatus Eisenbacteria bacterium]